jgi:thiamine pyrophosphokinase
VTPPPTFVVVVGGDGPVTRPDDLPAEAVVVAADGGLHLATELGLVAHHVVGDLDSVDADALADARCAGAMVHRHPADKDATDGELALDLVVELVGPTPTPRPRLLLLGRGGGRVDHLLADVAALAAPRLAGLDVEARLGAATVTVVVAGRARRITGTPHEQVSLLPVHGRARGVTTTGLRWALTDADLVPGTTRALSNELVGAEAEVRVGEGTVVVVQPGTTAHTIAPRTTAYDPTPIDPADPPTAPA